MVYGVKHVYKTRHGLTRFTLLLPLLPLLFLLTPDNARATSTECLDLVYCVSSSLQPDEFLESVEVNTEVLIATIQFTSQKESPSQLEHRFYKRKKELKKEKALKSLEKGRKVVDSGEGNRKLR